MGDGTIENPYTREDVLRLIEENGGTAEGLNLSRATFVEAIDLSGLDLHGIILKEAKFPTSFKHEIVEGADLRGTHLEKADLTRAHLERAELRETHLEGANLRDAHLEGAFLWDTHLEGANLMMVHLQGANLMRTKFSPDVNLEDVDWGNYILDEEQPGFFDSAVASYRHLKTWYTNAGVYDIAGQFFFREMTTNRKAMKWWPNPIHRIWSKFLSLICGYGERPLRVIVWAASVVVGLALIYFIIGSVWELSALWKSLYFSVVSFTALGYGTWVDKTWVDITNDWIRGLGAFESFIGVFTIALFLVTFIRKMTR